MDNSIVCPRCNAPHDYTYDNNGGKGQFACKVCNEIFSIGHEPKPLKLLCPHCSHPLEAIKNKKNISVSINVGIQSVLTI